MHARASVRPAAPAVRLGANALPVVRPVAHPRVPASPALEENNANLHSNFMRYSAAFIASVCLGYAITDQLGVTVRHTNKLGVELHEHPSIRLCLSLASPRHSDELISQLVDRHRAGNWTVRHYVLQ